MVANRRPNATSSRVTGDKKKAGLIRKYGLNMSRQAFREKAEHIGFKKVSSYPPKLISVRLGSCPSSATYALLLMMLLTCGVCFCVLAVPMKDTSSLRLGVQDGVMQTWACLGPLPLLELI